jgi:hypothetical protein
MNIMLNFFEMTDSDIEERSSFDLNIERIVHDKLLLKKPDFLNRGHHTLNLSSSSSSSSWFFFAEKDCRS